MRKLERLTKWCQRAEEGTWNILAIQLSLRKFPKIAASKTNSQRGVWRYNESTSTMSICSYFNQFLCPSSRTSTRWQAQRSIIYLSALAVCLSATKHHLVLCYAWLPWYNWIRRENMTLRWLLQDIFTFPCLALYLLNVTYNCRCWSCFSVNGYKCNHKNVEGWRNTWLRLVDCSNSIKLVSLSSLCDDALKYGWRKRMDWWVGGTKEEGNNKALTTVNYTGARIKGRESSNSAAKDPLSLRCRPPSTE